MEFSGKNCFVGISFAEEEGNSKESRRKVVLNGDKSSPQSINLILKLQKMLLLESRALLAEHSGPRN